MHDIEHDRDTRPAPIPARLRERQDAVTDLLLEWLREQEATTRDLSRRVSALERLVAPTTAPVPPAEQTPEHAPPDTSRNGAPAARRRGLLARLLSRRAGACAVCQREAPRGSWRELSKAGWTISGRASVCPGCRAMGWRLGDAGGLPFRRTR